MKRKLFAATIAATALGGGAAWAQGITLFGDARLGLGYNIENDGEVLIEDDDTPDDLRAISRVRFGVDMTGETDSGITFGATIRADNSEDGEGDTFGQRAGSVFVSGALGTLSFGDVDGADEQWVGDVPGDYTLTELDELAETLFVSNGGDFDSDSGDGFASNPNALPTIRYDLDIADFGVSLSSNRDLTDIGVGAGYAADFGGGSWEVGVGYYKFDSFIETGDGETIVLRDANGDPVEVEGTPVELVFPDGEQWSIGLYADYDDFEVGMTYVKLDSDTTEVGEFDADNLLIGASYFIDAWSFGAVYGKFLNASGVLEGIEGDDSYQLSAEYDLGGGASINGGVRRTYNIADLGGEPDGDSAWIGDFGIMMEF